MYHLVNIPIRAGNGTFYAQMVRAAFGSTYKRGPRSQAPLCKAVVKWRSWRGLASACMEVHGYKKCMNKHERMKVHERVIMLIMLTT